MSVHRLANLFLSISLVRIILSKRIYSCTIIISIDSNNAQEFRAKKNCCSRLFSQGIQTNPVFIVNMSSSLPADSIETVLVRPSESVSNQSSFVLQPPFSQNRIVPPPSSGSSNCMEKTISQFKWATYYQRFVSNERASCFSLDEKDSAPHFF